MQGGSPRAGGESRAARRAREQREKKLKKKKKAKAGSPSPRAPQSANLEAQARFLTDLDDAENVFQQGGASAFRECKRMLENIARLPHQTGHEGRRVYGLAETCAALGEVLTALQWFTMSLSIAQGIHDKEATTRCIAGIDSLRDRLFANNNDGHGSRRGGLALKDVAKLTAGMLVWAHGYVPTEAEGRRNASPGSSGSEWLRYAMTASNIKRALVMLDWVSVLVLASGCEGSQTFKHTAEYIRSSIQGGLADEIATINAMTSTPAKALPNAAGVSTHAVLQVLVILG